MATLPTNYQDDVLDTSQNQNRKYEQVQNQDGTISLVDRTVYLQQGSQLGAGDVNAQNTEINALNSRLTLISGEDVAKFTLDKQGGKWGWNEDPARGADTFHPFSSGIGYAYAEFTCYPNSSGYLLDFYDDSGVKIGGSPAVGTQFSTSQDLYEDMLFRAYLNFINASASTIRFYAKEPIKVNDTPVSVGNYVEYNWKSNIKAKIEQA